MFAGAQHEKADRWISSKPIISRGRFASASFSTSARRFIMDLVIGCRPWFRLFGNPTLPGSPMATVSHTTFPEVTCGRMDQPGLGAFEGNLRHRIDAPMLVTCRRLHSTVRARRGRLYEPRPKMPELHFKVLGGFNKSRQCTWMPPPVSSRLVSSILSQSVEPKPSTIGQHPNSHRRRCNRHLAPIRR